MEVVRMTGIGARSGVNRVQNNFLEKCHAYVQAQHMQGIGSVVKKISLAIPRNAYLALVAENAFGIATHIAAANQKNAGAVRKIWEKLGGNYSKLLGTVGSGSKKPRLLGINGIGEPVTLSALLAAAGAIAAAVGNAIKGISPESSAADDLTKAATAAGGASEVVSAITNPAVVGPDPNNPTTLAATNANQVAWAWTSPSYTSVKTKPEGKIINIPSSVKVATYDPNAPVSVSNRPGTAPQSAPVTYWLVENGYLPKNIQIMAPDGTPVQITDSEVSGSGSSSNTSTSSTGGGSLTSFLPLALIALPFFGK